MATTTTPSGLPTPGRTDWPWKLSLLLPYLGLCFPQFYMRATPALFGFPFFYWYQFLWVILTSAILAVYYLRTRRNTTP